MKSKEDNSVFLTNDKGKIDMFSSNNVIRIIVIIIASVLLAYVNITEKRTNNDNVMSYELYQEIKPNFGTENETIDDSYSNINYKVYNNTRFGYSIQYPDTLIEQAAPINNDGRKFLSSDSKVSLLVFAGYNVFYQNSKTMMNEEINTLSNVVFKNLSDKSYEISWIEGSDVYYLYRIVNEVYYEFTLKYPAEYEDYFRDVKKTCYNSFNESIKYK